MTIDRTPFNVMLSDEDRAHLEKHRVRMGLRSHGEAIRALISPARSAPMIEDIVLRGREPVEARETALAGWAKGIDVQLGPTKPKPGSMLKKDRKS